MNNKKVTYVLVVAVACVWGIIVFRVLGFFNNNNTISSSFRGQEEQSNSSVKNDSVVLIASYSDPFLGSWSENSRTNSFPENTHTPSGNIEIVQKKIDAEPVNKEVLEWPAITYNGMVLHKATGKVIGLATIKNQDYLIWPDSIYNGVSIHRLFRDSMVVSFRKERRVITRLF